MDPTNEPVKSVIVAQSDPVPPPSVRREQEVIASYIRPSEPEMPAGELKEFGVDVINQHQPNLTEQHYRSGIVHAPEVAPIPTQASSLRIFTPGEEKVAQGASIGSSVRWLFEIVKKMSNKTQREGGTV